MASLRLGGTQTGKLMEPAKKISSSPSSPLRGRGLGGGFWKTIASGFGSGYSPVAPGTAGALLAALVLWALHDFLQVPFDGGWGQTGWLLPLIGFSFFLGVIAAAKVEPEWGHDPSKVVVDEMVGLWIAMLGVPFSWVNLVLAFVLFRIFDIWKPLGVRRLERLPGGWGVMMDDVLAGVYACLLLHVWIYFQH
jgi:phosphatidylglycerophosphatase A